MFRYFYRFQALFAVVILSGCATATIAMKEDNIDAKVSGSPYIKPLSKSNYLPRTLEKDIEVYYKTWNFLTEPSAIINWEAHFKISEGSHPKGKYQSLAEVTHYQKTRNDNDAVSFLRSIAAKQGGDAVIDVWRSPAIDSISLPANILGYRYHGVIIRYEPVQ